MIQINKLAILLVFFFIFTMIPSPFFQHNGNRGVWALKAAYAQDEEPEKKKEDKAEGEGENPCPECPECPDPAKVVLRGLEDKKNAIDKQQKILEKQRKDLAIFEDVDAETTRGEFARR